VYGEAINDHIEDHIFECNAGIGNELSDHHVSRIEGEHNYIEGIKSALRRKSNKERPLYPQLVNYAPHEEIEY
jgi:hypothetical protein